MFSALAQKEWWVFFTSFKGRTARTPYNLFGLGLIIMTLISTLIDYMIMGPAFLGRDEIHYAGWIFTIISVWPGTAIVTRRLHDRNKSGWLQVYYVWLPTVAYCMLGYFIESISAHANLLTMLGILIVLFTLGITIVVFTIILSCAKGTKGPNRFGPDPLEENKIVTEGTSL